MDKKASGTTSIFSFPRRSSQEWYNLLFQDTQIPPTIYKYRVWDIKNGKSHRLLTGPEIYFASPEELNDPLDCGVHGHWMELFSNETLRKFHNHELIRNLKVFAPKALPLLYQASANILRDQFRTFSGIFSASKTPFDSNLWLRYSDGGAGFCVGFDTRWLIALTMKEIRQDRKNRFIQYMHVEYCNIHPTLFKQDEDQNSQAWFIQFFKYKTEEWKYEQEFRIVSMFDRVQINKDRILKLPLHSIKEVILGHLMIDKQKKEIRDHLRTIDPKGQIKVLQAIQNNNGTIECAPLL